MLRPALLVTLCVGALALAPANVQQQTQSPAINRAYLDTTCAPCQDFWRFANGAWVDSATIPPGASSIGRDDEIAGRNNRLLRSILDSLVLAPQRHARTQSERNVGMFYAACMDSARSVREELAPLDTEMRLIAAITTIDGLSETIGRHAALDISEVFWFVTSTRDPADPLRSIAELRSITGWALPLRQAYTAADANMQRVRDGYIAALTGVFAQLGDAPDVAASNARSVLTVETALVNVPRDTGGPLERRTLAELQQGARGFNWNAFSRGIGRPDLPAILTRALMRERIDSLVRTIPLDAWRAYLRWQVAWAFAPMTTNSLDRILTPFRNAMSGAQAARSRAGLCVNIANQFLGNAIARAYVAQRFSAADRVAATALAEQVRGAFRERLSSLDWLSDNTRRRARTKLDSLQLWIGYPDQWGDDVNLTLRPGPGVQLMMELRQAGGRRAVASIGSRIDRTRWIEANPAYLDVSNYNNRNALLITAAALQSPAFDTRADVVTNLTSIGFGVGHELSHAFDSRGRLYNENGILEDWWTADESREYQRRANLIVQQINEYTIIDSVKANGRRTLTESISDIGGVALVYLAFKRATAGQRDVMINGFTREQRFFIALAQGKFRTKQTSETLRAMSESDHNIDRIRLNSSLANLAAFAAAFGCKEGDAMVRAAALRGSIW